MHPDQSMLNVLLVEDREEDALLISRVLSRDFDLRLKRVELAGDYEKALSEKEWDVVLADYSLPGFSGIHALKIIRKLGLDTPFIILSGTITDETAVEAMRAGAQDYVMKDNLQRLVPAIQREVRDAGIRREQRIAEERRSLLWQIVRDPVWDWDLSTGRREWSESFYTQLGYTREDVPLHNRWWAQQVLDTDLMNTLTSLRTAVDMGQTRWAAEYRFRNAAGEYVKVIDRAAIIYNSLKQPVRLIGVMIDLSSRSNSSRNSQEHALAKLSHELRIPLHNIVSGMEMLKEEMLGPLTDKQREYTDMIDANARQLLILSNDVLDSARLEAGKMKLSFRPVNIHELLRETVHMMKPLLQQKLQTCEVEIPPEVPETFWADPVRIKQILINLLSNAHKFSPEGKAIRIHSRLVDDELCLSVQDEGPGIAEDEIESILKPFEQGKFEQNGDIQGAGLGLPLVISLVEMHRGRFHVDSKPGAGSRFAVCLPLSSVGSTG